MNTPVKFELAKLLEEQGYPFEFITVGELKEVPLNIPTIADVVMWLYEKHGIWIGVQPTSIVGKFQFRTYYNNKGVMNQHWNDSMSKQFNSPTEAYEAAIEYTLNNLI